MVFQVVAPRQLPGIEIGRQRVAFVYQASGAFVKSNRPEWLSQLRTDAGFAKVAGIELTLLDICRYYHRAAGIGGAAQVIQDLGNQAQPSILAKAAAAYENTAVRRLGFLLERFGHIRQAHALRPFVQQAKSYKALDPAAQPLAAALYEGEEKSQDWKLLINVPIEIDL